MRSNQAGEFKSIVKFRRRDNYNKNNNRQQAERRVYRFGPGTDFGASDTNLPARRRTARKNLRYAAF